jgi:uncharacterized protein (DUF488 family)
MARIYTVGHSTRSTEELISILRNHGIRLLLDVRKIPKSRFNSHFNKNALDASLSKAGIEYGHFPELGGMRKSVPGSINAGWRDDGFRGFADYMLTREFKEAVQSLIEQASQKSLAIMCAEADYTKCHRMLISDALKVRGVEVLHIKNQTELVPHKLTPFARIDGVRVTYPGGDPSQPSLF